MTYVIAKTQYLGKKWASTHLDKTEKFVVLSTSNQIRGRRLFLHTDCLYLLGGLKQEVIDALMPALTGCKVFSQDRQ